VRYDASDGLASTNQPTQGPTEYDELLEGSSLEVAPSMPGAATDADVVAIRAIAGLRPDVSSPTTFVEVPADTASLTVIQTALGGIASQLRFSLDEIEDLRIAVDEACGSLLAVAIPGSELRCQFSTSDDTFTVEVSVAARPSARLPSVNSFALKVLWALTDNIHTDVSDGRASIRLTKHSGQATQPVGDA
jgi:serine/threonine-protein kinase RsbW